MSASKPQKSSSVRIGHSLNTNEEEFVNRRKDILLKCLETLDIKCSQVPKIALLGSGGGERAMVGLLGSLDQLGKAGLLDCFLYLCGVSGSTWCMASLYQEPDWSSNLETVKQKIVQRLSGRGVSWSEAFSKLKTYYYEKDIFSLTDAWAVMVITSYVKEIDEHKLSEWNSKNSKDPYPIYTVIDKRCKQHKEADPWFEITPHEAGYSLIGAFVDISGFGSQFENGSKNKNQPEIDMLYLQALCGSALADEDEISKFLWEKLKEFFHHSKSSNVFEEMQKDPGSPPVHIGYQVLMDLMDMNLSVLDGIDPSPYDTDIREKLAELSGGKSQLIFDVGTLDITDKAAAKVYMKQYTKGVCNYAKRWFSFWPYDCWTSICKCMVGSIWGRNYNFLHNTTDGSVPSVLQSSEKRDYEDAGLLLNSPFISVLREERDVNLIISLDFSEGDPFLTVTEAAKKCEERNIPFPRIIPPSEDSTNPKDFYVFEGKGNAPTVIHIPLFNTVNCGDKLEEMRKKYKTFQGSYSEEMINELMELAGKNITNNKEKLLEWIRKAANEP
ncbi:cytosolic phospholipase A2 gamma-like isoform X2 [Xyrauchen texanus]|uniref:cytosolic phospholipase A2 gamma-like isoform X1 n=1 Tax=Xyrauchen texanus TaxID=154827 RepID=UPI00224263C3|nr:cytosolic phospholipase A2 gamma-like isoform X1 [Xyrauchen texanus]XP_051981885.1 cytosolic phospholipase A2 gamma-like isoform X2 [Xyrauchen texanus]